MPQGYAHPEKLVTTQMVADHLNDPGVRIVESNEDLLLYSRRPHSRRSSNRLGRRPQRPDHAGLPGTESSSKT